MVYSGVAFAGGRVNRAGGLAIGWVCLLLVVALATYALEAGASAATNPSPPADDATDARWLASVAGPNAGGSVVRGSGAVGYATPPARLRTAGP
jgi:hypothetical protein